MKFDYIEIGTSDFKTMCQEHPNLVGLSIEPLDIYCNRLPAQDNVIRLNCAISNFKATNGVVWYVHPDDIDAFDLPQWLKGCNSFQNMHPSVKAELEKRQLLRLFRFKYVEVLTWQDLVARYDITHVNYLKIDTEGHDLVIINNMLDWAIKSSRCPDEILFESNILINEDELKCTLERLKFFGYEIIYTNNENTLVKKVRVEG
jgi:hypothetical protein